MYIRRKVFSVIEDEQGVERYFSTTEFINEDSYLAEAMYSDDDSDYVGGAAKGIVGTAAGAGALAGAGYGVKKGAEALAARGRNARRAEYEAAIEEKMAKKNNVKSARKATGRAEESYKNALRSGEESIAATSAESALNVQKKKLEAIEKEARKKITSGKNGVKMAKAGTVERLANRANVAIRKATKALEKNKKVAGLAAAGTAAAGAGYGAYRAKKD